MGLHEWKRRWHFRRHRQAEMDDLEQEMRLHRELRARQLQQGGATQAEAVRAAQRRFGNATLLKERSGEMWGCNWLEDLVKDVRYAVRSLQSHLLFTTVTVLTIALGIGTNTAIFSVMNAVLLRALPVHDPQRLVHLRVVPGQPGGANNTGDSNTSFCEPVFQQLRQQHRAFSDLVAYVPAGYDKISVRVGTLPEEAQVDLVSGNFFSGLGVPAVCGRTLTPADEKNHTAVAVLGYRFWSNRGEGSCSVIGRTIYIKGLPFTVVGVASRTFTGFENSPTDVWIPLQIQPELNAWGTQGASFYAEPNWWCLRLVGRLASGITPKQARAMLFPVFRQAAYEHLGGKPRPGEKPSQLDFAPVRGAGQRPEGWEEPLQILMAMVGLVLLIACGNVAMLLRARNAARQREFSIRLALGGSQMRLFRQLLAESLVLVIAGAVLGLCFAWGATGALAAWAQFEFSLAPDRRVLLFTVALSLLTGFIFGVAPLMTSVRMPVALALKNSAATVFRDQGKAKVGRAVVVLQVALCLTLAIGAGLLVSTLRNLQNLNLGFRTGGLLVFGVSPQLKTNSSQNRIQFYTDLLARLRALPGVESATLMQNRIGSGWSNNTNAFVDGRDPRTIAQGMDSNMMRWNIVGPHYFRTLGVPISQGRDLTEADSAVGPKVAVVNQAFIQRFLKGREALGHQVSYNLKTSYTIVGVAANSKYIGIREEDIPMAYFPFTQFAATSTMHVELRTASDPLRFLPVVQKAVSSFAPDLALLQPKTQQAQFEETIADLRLVARLALCFGLLAVVLVMTGLYGTLAYSVQQRTSEFGVRMAMGAQPQAVLWLILRESLALCLIGVAMGLPLAFASTRLLRSLLYGLAPHDPFVLWVATVGLVVVCLVAGLIPARRAASVDPIVAIRYE